MKLALSFLASLIAVGCTAGNGTTGLGGAPASGTDPEADGGTTVTADGGVPKTDGGASADASTNDAVPLTPHFDITINGTPATLTQLYPNLKDLSSKTTTHAVWMQGLFQGAIIPGGQVREAGMGLELTTTVPKGTASCEKVDLMISYYLASGASIEARPLNPGGSCVVTITEPATGGWTAGTVTGIATSSDGSRPITFSLNWAQKTIE